MKPSPRCQNVRAEELRETLPCRPGAWEGLLRGLGQRPMATNLSSSFSHRHPGPHHGTMSSCHSLHFSAFFLFPILPLQCFIKTQIWPGKCLKCLLLTPGRLEQVSVPKCVHRDLELVVAWEFSSLRKTERCSPTFTIAAVWWRMGTLPTFKKVLWPFDLDSGASRADTSPPGRCRLSPSFSRESARVVSRKLAGP